MDDLYFFATDAGHVKIGRGVNPKTRLSTIQCGCPHPLELLGALPGMGWQERAWHRAFGDYHIRGEWFHHTPDLKDAIEKSLAGEEWIATLEPSTASIMEAYRRWEPAAKPWFPEPLDLARNIWRNAIADLEDVLETRMLQRAEAA